jgi:putative FmdB family regulatory protein
VPIFEYECLKCEHVFEQLVLGPASAESVACPACRSRRVEKLFSGFAARTRTGEGTVRSLSSGCSGCHASSCAGCK